VAVTKPYVEIAVSFASALVDGDFELASSFLTPELRLEFTPESLRENLFGMFVGYAPDSTPQTIHFDEDGVLDEWPAKRSGDRGWVYVGIAGPDFVEAVTVIVAEVDGQLLIRDIEWGRP
jgi:hypothetical protein